jgi:hypothetical protein
MASTTYNIRTPRPELGDGGETLKQAHSLALLMSTSDRLDDEGRDGAVLILDLLEKAYGELEKRCTAAA